jgi:Na+-translocating ferredoxin:NAD+ oxidoreductase subunit G
MSKSNEKNNGIFQIALNLTMASLISGTVLASTYFVTAPFAKQQRIRQKDLTMRELIPGANTFQPVEGKDGWYVAVTNTLKLGYIIPGESKGFGGSIKILTAVSTNDRVIEYKILSHNETPGLGDKAAVSPFRDQFRDKTLDGLVVVKNHDTNKIDAITGATITSRAVTKAVRESLEQFGEFLKKPL